MDNDRPIEKTLREFAKKRRDDAGTPLELHPATRRMLHGEVARQFPKPAAGDAMKTAGLATWWPRFAWVASVLVVLGVSVWVFFPKQQNTRGAFDLAKNSLPQNSPAQDKEKLFEAPAKSEAKPATTKQLGERTLASANTVPAQPQNAPVTWGADTLNFKDETKLGTAPAQPHIASSGLTLSEPPGREPQPDARLDAGLAATGGEQSKAVNLALAPPVASAGALAPDGFGRSGFGGGGARASAPALAARSRTVTAPAVTAPSAPLPAEQMNRVASYGLFSNQAQTLSQNFVQTGVNGQFRNAAKSTVPNQVLAAFQVEQSGNQLRVIDNDGSTYTGGIEMAVDKKDSSIVTAQTGTALPKMESALAAGQTTAAPASTAQNAQNFSFRVAGTNRTLNQAVVFTGNIEGLANVPGAFQQQITAGAAISLDKAKMQQQSLPLLQNSVINGRAQVGAGQQIEINAVPAAP